MQASGRQRTALEHGWRFRLVPATDVDPALAYEPRPEIGEDADGKEADARPEEARSVVERGGLKPWILPTANRFIGDPEQRHAVPAHPPAVAPEAAGADLDDGDWDLVDLPHDWAIAGPFLQDGPHGGMGRLPSWGVAWYRRTIEVPADGRSVFLDVDGAMSHASVWLNGHLVGGWPYGYNGWRVDLTPFVVAGANQLAIRLDNPGRSARWYPGGGLYRDVWLLTCDPLHVAQWGTSITTTAVSAESASLALEVEIDNDGEAAVRAEVVTEIFALDDEGERHGDAVARVEPVAVFVPAGGSRRVHSSATIENPRLWGPLPTQHPHRYLAVTTIRRDDTAVDSVETPFGIRTVRFDPADGLLVNGERIPIQGVNNHHDLGALGAAFHVRAAERQLEILRDMGTNAIRTAHNPPAPELLDLTDRMGILVLDEVFDSWQQRKTDLDFHLVFDDWHEPDLRAMIRRDRHHPSIILWGIGNEVGEQYTDDEGAAIGRRLAEIARDEDPTRPVTTAMNYAKPDMPLPGVVDVIGLNYQGEGIRQEPEFKGTDRIRTPPQYEPFHEAHPDKAIISTETASTLSSRGVYLFPVAPTVSAPVREGHGGDGTAHHVSAYELYAVDFGSTPDKVFTALDRHPFVAGEFVWTGFDYLGEPTPYYSSRSSYSGIVDLAGFPKNRFWLYQSRWRPELPMAHLLPHWTWPGREGEVTPVHVFTSGDEGELFVNGVSQGRRRKGDGEHRLRWDDVRYEPGEVRVETFRDDQPWASAEMRTAGEPAALELVTDREVIAADGRDLAFVSVRVLDADGVPDPTASMPLQLEVTGPADLVATDNGDPTDMTPFPSGRRAAFSGRALAIVRGRPGEHGPAEVRVSAAGLTGATAALTLGPAPGS